MVKEVYPEQIACDLSTMDKEWFWKIPCHPGRPYPLSFMRYNLTKMRRKWWLFGEWIIVLSPLGKEVRDHILKIEYMKAHQ